MNHLRTANIRHFGTSSTLPQVGEPPFCAPRTFDVDHSVLYSRQTFWNAQQLSKHNKRQDQVTFLVTNPRLEIGDKFIGFSSSCVSLDFLSRPLYPNVAQSEQTTSRKKIALARVMLLFETSGVRRVRAMHQTGGGSDHALIDYCAVFRGKWGRIYLIYIHIYAHTYIYSGLHPQKFVKWHLDKLHDGCNCQQIKDGENVWCK